SIERCRELVPRDGIRNCILASIKTLEAFRLGYNRFSVDGGDKNNEPPSTSQRSPRALSPQ
ncbi:MAG: hypothetical protein RQ885_01890, partial [Desulfurococcales archaeon]|nr:hypothetical protein [Desulfurococcales archaeon]